MSQGYRPEVDGLRAVAVVPVVFFHAGFKYFSGGYVGVDVFFVVSGYLITGILYDEIKRVSFLSLPSMKDGRGEYFPRYFLSASPAFLLPGYGCCLKISGSSVKAWWL